MGAAAYSRGSGLVAREADAQMPVAHTRADRAAFKEERERMLAQIATLERELARARRCIAELRRSKDARIAEARADAASSQAAIEILCRLSFPGDHAAAARSKS